MAVKITGSVVAEGRTRSINVRRMLATLPRIELLIYPHLMQLSFMAETLTKMTSQQKGKLFLERHFPCKTWHNFQIWPRFEDATSILPLCLTYEANSVIFFVFNPKFTTSGNLWSFNLVCSFNSNHRIYEDKLSSLALQNLYDLFIDTDNSEYNFHSRWGPGGYSISIIIMRRLQRSAI